MRSKLLKNAIFLQLPFHLGVKSIALALKAINMHYDIFCYSCERLFGWRNI